MSDTRMTSVMIPIIGLPSFPSAATCDLQAAVLPAAFNPDPEPGKPAFR
jgi:hypothetical protein